MECKIKIFILVLLLCILSCGNQAHKKANEYVKKADYKSAIVHLEQAEIEHPSDWKIKRDLGIAYFKKNQIKIAINKLSEAYQIHPNDGRTLLYLGLSYETAQMYSKATSVYRYYLTLKVKGPLRKEIIARLRENTNKKLRQEIKANLDNLSKGRVKSILPNSLAVLYFRNISQWTEFNPILKGITEIIITDLSKIKLLHVIERKKLQILLEELNLSSSDFFDKLKASDVGKMLITAKLISGGIERISDTKIRINAGLVDTKTGLLRGKGTETEGSISDILVLAKQLVFDLISDMGIKLSQNERDAIKLIATKNSLAFIAFCKGVNFEDQKQFAQARTQFGKAVKLDPEFTLAKQMLEQLPRERLTLSEMEKLAVHENMSKRLEKDV